MRTPSEKSLERFLGERLNVMVSNQSNISSASCSLIGGAYIRYGLIISLILQFIYPIKVLYNICSITEIMVGIKKSKYFLLVFRDVMLRVVLIIICIIILLIVLVILSLLLVETAHIIIYPSLTILVKHLFDIFI